MSVANSARTQIAEALARQIFGHRAMIQSAGSQPVTVNPLAVQIMDEAGLDISGQRAKRWEELPADFVKNLDVIIYVGVEKMTIHGLGQKVRQIHWPLPDPLGLASHEAQVAAFRATREVLKEQIQRFFVTLEKLS